MKERIKKLRKTLDLTQQEFANRLGISRGNIATYETRDGSPGNSVISLICREFNVSETWLRTGEGEMFVERTREDELSAFVEQLLHSEPDDIRRRFVAALSRLSEKELEILAKAAVQLADELHLSSAPAPPDRAQWEREADEFAAIAREQFLSEKIQESQASSAPASAGSKSAS